MHVLIDWSVYGNMKFVFPSWGFSYITDGYYYPPVSSLNVYKKSVLYQSVLPYRQHLLYHKILHGVRRHNVQDTNIYHIVELTTTTHHVPVGIVNVIYCSSSRPRRDKLYKTTHKLMAVSFTGSDWKSKVRFINCFCGSPFKIEFKTRNRMFPKRPKDVSIKWYWNTFQHYGYMTSIIELENILFRLIINSNKSNSNKLIFLKAWKYTLFVALILT